MSDSLYNKNLAQAYLKTQAILNLQQATIAPQWSVLNQNASRWDVRGGYSGLAPVANHKFFATLNSCPPPNRFSNRR